MKTNTASPNEIMYPVPLYHHQTDGGAEYLTDKFIKLSNGEKEGILKGATIMVRLDGEPEVTISDPKIHMALVSLTKEDA